MVRRWFPILPGRWALVRDLKGPQEPRAYCSTRRSDRARDFMMAWRKRWTSEMTCAASQAPLGVATPRPWADPGHRVPFPRLRGRYTLRTLLPHALYPHRPLPVQPTAWYVNSHATFVELSSTLAILAP
jgi:hypothetical protein